MTINAILGNRALLVLIIANLLPILGVLLLDWDVFEIVVLYWFENVVIGAINILKMITCRAKPVPAAASPAAQQPSKFFIIPFFTVHYGMFCFVHGVFVFALLGGKGESLSSRGSPFKGLGESLGELFGSGAVIFVLAIVLSHLFSFFANYIGKGEYRRITASQLMGAPYGRIVVLHIAILFGAFAVMAFGNSIFLLILLIVGKIVIDAKLHLRSHRKIDASSYASWSQKG